MDNQVKRILVVEDDQFLRELYQELLAGEGYLVDVAVDGAIALQKIQEGGFDLVLLDIMLPKMDGINVLKTLKISPPKKANGPIVCLTNLGQNTIIKECFDLGAAGYLIKSALNPDEVLTEIKAFLIKSPNG